MWPHQKKEPSRTWTPWVFFFFFAHLPVEIVNRHKVHFHRLPPEKHSEKGPQQEKEQQSWRLTSLLSQLLSRSYHNNWEWSHKIHSDEVPWKKTSLKWRFMGKLGSTRGQWSKGKLRDTKFKFCFTNTHLCGLVACKLWHKSLCTVTHWQQENTHSSLNQTCVAQVENMFLSDVKVENLQH